MPRSTMQMVCLSATVSNNQEFADWVGERRGPTRLIATDHRPVPLESMYMIKDKYGGADAAPSAHVREQGGQDPRQSANRAHAGTGDGAGAGASRRPNRIDTVERLAAEEGMLPAIYFIFSRAGL